jgi:hypothetical protein
MRCSLGAASSILRLHPTPDGGIVADIVDGTTEEVSVRRIAADGEILWTRTSDQVIALSDFAMGFSAVAANGNVAHVVRRGVDSSQGVRLVTYNSEGALLVDSIIGMGANLTPLDITYDAAGALVIAAREEVGEDLYDAWVARVSGDGDAIWIRRMEIDPDDEIAYGVLARSDGRLYVTGIDAAAPDFFVIEGDVWIAELMP